jgi:hypothetical protein
MMVRTVSEAGVSVRLVTPIELFQFLGWDRRQYVSPEDAERSGKYTPGTLTSLAGNAFSAFAAVPWVITTLIVAGSVAR